MKIVRQIYFKISSRLNVSFICQINFTPSFLLAIDTPLLTRLHTKERLMIPEDGEEKFQRILELNISHVCSMVIESKG